MDHKKDKSSPLKGPPLRQAGQSIDDQLRDTLLDGVLFPVFVSVMFVMFAGYQWLASIADIPPSPIFMSLVALTSVVYAAYRIRSTLKATEPLRLARAGERSVGQYLELLRQDGVKVFHDLLGDGFNVDHVLICEQGVFVIETKTYSKRKDSTVRFSDTQLLVDGYDKFTELMTQARAEAFWLKSILEESTGRHVFPRSIIVFPGWWVKSSVSESADVLVMNPRMLPEFLSHQPKVLVSEEVSLFAFHLSRYSRSTSS